VYTRAQAIDDGVLVDVTETAAEAGFKVPVALSAALWAEAVAWDESRGALQDEKGRLWDCLWMAYCTARRGGSGSSDGGTDLVTPGGETVDVKSTRYPNGALLCPANRGWPTADVLVLVYVEAPQAVVRGVISGARFREIAETGDHYGYGVTHRVHQRDLNSWGEWV